MKREEYGLITFKTTHFALEAERLFKNEHITCKTIPTPREVSHSCGLSLLFMMDDLARVQAIIDKGQITIDGLFGYTKVNHKNLFERLI
ncbi:MAG TPA: DUF3343 domain-containing protein [Tissierellaceae bacterium]|nr:DUF3343 domain-containing protein [Tissierellaceae bacterium]